LRTKSALDRLPVILTDGDIGWDFFYKNEFFLCEFDVDSGTRLTGRGFEAG
jgi:hypothetical protein